MEWVVWLGAFFLWGMILWIVVIKPLERLLFRKARRGSITDDQVKQIVHLDFLRECAPCPSARELAEMSSFEASSLIGQRLNRPERAVAPSWENREQGALKKLDEVRRVRAQTLSR